MVGVHNSSLSIDESDAFGVTFKGHLLVNQGDNEQCNMCHDRSTPYIGDKLIPPFNKGTPYSGYTTK